MTEPIRKKQTRRKTNKRKQKQRKRSGDDIGNVIATVRDLAVAAVTAYKIIKPLVSRKKQQD